MSWSSHSTPSVGPREEFHQIATADLLLVNHPGWGITPWGREARRSGASLLIRIVSTTLGKHHDEA